MIGRVAFIALLWSALPARAALTDEITPAETALPPSRERVEALVDRAAQAGWGNVTQDLRRSAFAAFEGRSGSAAAWYYLYRWAALLGTPERQALGGWVKAVNRARVGHVNMGKVPVPAAGVLADHWSREMQSQVLGSVTFSEEFFTTYQPVDQPVEVLGILQQIHDANPAAFAEYQNLAIAIAVVYDVPPPPSWPHAQVDAGALPRTLPAPVAAFQYWVRLDRAGQTLQHLRQLPAGELKFVVDEVAPFSELDWARKNLPEGLADLAKTYDLIHYRKDRFEQKRYLWPQAEYSLPTILREGGICVDQAYFAAVSGKAKGVPTITFLGEGLDGRHAWFGYLDARGKWQLDCGRYAEQKLDVGTAYDPQTWGTITDFELRFLSDRFRMLPGYKLSLLHAELAAEYLRDGKIDQARKAARESVNRERRDLDGWNILLQAEAAANPAPRVLEGVIREAIFAFHDYPDLKKTFTLQLTASLRARGETSAADFEEQGLVKVYANNQADVSCQQAVDLMERTMREDAVPQQVHVYQQVLDAYGRGAGYEFFDRVVEPFAIHLQEHRQVPAAIAAVERARKYLRLDKAGRLDDALTALSDRLKADN